MITPLPAAAADDDALMTELAALINRAYDAGERGLWREGAARTSVEEVTRLARDAELLVAHLGDRCVGVVRVQTLRPGLGEFGLLAAAQDRLGLGIGRALVAGAESRCAARGHHRMQLELLVPQNDVHPAKQALDTWYRRIGYRPVCRDSFAESHPHLAPQLAVPCDFVVYEKRIVREAPSVPPD